ncbi:MAG: hypothetical protein V4557_12505 [Bacteroidota bacterium]
MDSIQEARKIRPQHKLSAGRISCKKDKAKMRTIGEHAHDFLKQSFRPVTALMNPSRVVIKKAKESFINSIQNLASLYGFKPNLVSIKKYPFCIAELFANTQAEMIKRSANVELLIVQEDDGYPVIATVKEIDIGLTLYYVPLDALRFLHQREKGDTFNLLLSVYSYLHHIAGMPLLNTSSYIQGEYDMMEQSYSDNEDEFEEQEYRGIMEVFTAAKRYSSILNKHIANTTNLLDFINRIEQFKPADDFDANLLSLSKKIHALWRQFPDEKFASNNAGEFLHPDEEDDRAYIDQFFSFCWASDGWMMDQLLEWVNCELQEKTIFDVPFSIQKFETPHTEIIHEFSFQKQLLELLNELADILNDLYA